MKLALLLPGYLDSPDYLHMRVFEKRLIELGYTIERLDPCNLWKTGDVGNYSITNYLKQIKQRIDHYKTNSPTEIVVIGHSLGGFTSILAGSLFPDITKIVALCPPASIDNLGEKWEGKPFRVSKRNLPTDGSKYREFNVPLTFVDDARKYSAIEAIHKINIPLMIFIALSDTSVLPKETETLVSETNNPYVVRQKNMGHDFRQSEIECNTVMAEIEKFLGKQRYD